MNFDAGRAIWMAAFAMVFAMLVPARASALPIFARRYGFSCTTCHSGGPTVLNEFGETFRDNGYRIPSDDASYVARRPVLLGAPARATLFPNTVWPGEIPGDVPVALSALLGAVYTQPGTATDSPRTLDTPAGVRFLVAGSLGEHISAFAVLNFYDTLQLEQVYAIFRGILTDWFGEMGLSVKVGQFVPDILPEQPTLRRADTLPYALSQPIGRDGFTLANNSQGIELYGLLFGRLKWVVGVVNGNKPIDDIDARRDYFGRISVLLGGPRRDRLDPGGAANPEPNVSLGAFVYSGVATNVPGPSDTFPRYRNDIFRAGGDLRFRGYGLDVIAQGVVGVDSDATEPGERVAHVSWAIDAEYQVYPWLIPYGRFEEIRFDTPTFPDQRRALLGAAIFVRANVRVRLEGVLGLTPYDASLARADLFIAL